MGSLTVFKIPVIDSRNVFGYLTKITACMVAEHTRKLFHRTLSLHQTNFRVCSASVQILIVFTWISNKRMLSQQGNDLIASRAYTETIPSFDEHTQKRFYH
jgi:hypothetical protein